MKPDMVRAAFTYSEPDILEQRFGNAAERVFGWRVGRFWRRLR